MYIENLCFSLTLITFFDNFVGVFRIFKSTCICNLSDWINAIALCYLSPGGKCFLSHFLRVGPQAYISLSILIQNNIFSTIRNVNCVTIQDELLILVGKLAIIGEVGWLYWLETKRAKISRCVFLYFFFGKPLMNVLCTK